MDKQETRAEEGLKGKRELCLSWEDECSLQGLAFWAWACSHTLCPQLFPSAWDPLYLSSES